MVPAALTPFELTAGALQKLGINLIRLPGEYLVDFHNGAGATAQNAETIGEALDLGRGRPSG